MVKIQFCFCDNLAQFRSTPRRYQCEWGAGLVTRSNKRSIQTLKSCEKALIHHSQQLTEDK